MTTLVMPMASEASEFPAGAVDDVSDIQDAAPAAPAGDWITLRQSGKSPYRFKGAIMATSTGYYCGSRLWYEINLYTKSSGGFVLDLRVFKKSDTDRDLFKVTQLDTVDEIAEYLEHYDPSADVKIPFDASDSDISTSDMAMHAVSLRQSVDEATRDFRALSGDLLFQLNQTAA